MGRAGWRALMAGLLVSNAATLIFLQLERSTHSSADARLASTSEQLRMLARSLDTEKARSERLVHERRQIVESASGMTQRLKTRTAKAAVRNASSVLAEAIPYVGVGAMLTVTALDLKDACETMRDINAVHTVLDLERTDTNQVCGLSLPSLKDIAAEMRKVCGKTMICRGELQQSFESDSAESVRN